MISSLAGQRTGPGAVAIAALAGCVLVFLIAPVVPLAFFYLGYLVVRERRIRRERRSGLLLERESRARDAQLLREGH